jgi:hypothetical protein
LSGFVRVKNSFLSILMLSLNILFEELMFMKRFYLFIEKNIVLAN